MGLLDVFKRGTPVERQLKDLREPFAQPEARRAAMSKLFEIGTEEALEALLVRFTFNCNGHIADESEKRDLVDELVRVGKPAVEPIKRFIKKEKFVGFPIRALSRILPRDEVLALLAETLSAFEPLDHRTTEQKRALIDALGELGSAAQAKLVVPYLGDHHDDVQIQAVEALERLKDPETYEALAEVCCSQSHSARIMRRAAQALETLEPSVRGQFDRFHPELKAEYLLTKKGTLTKKGRPAASKE
ncbi:MAG: HEAT repeat domain-containing protein [Deltaproteobacteria bacterium]|nr:HEAT repeat domain-containing protein [Deltaproteobacteria bacterium]